MSNLDTKGRLIGRPGDTLEQFLATANPDFRRTGECGITVALEVPRVAPVIENLADIEYLLALERSPSLGLTFAPPHLALAEQDLAEAIGRIGQRVMVLYLRTVKPDHGGSRDGRNYGPSTQQLGSDGALDLSRAAKTLLEKGKTRDYMIIARGTEHNPDSEAVAPIVRASLEQVPEPLLKNCGRHHDCLTESPRRGRRHTLPGCALLGTSPRLCSRKPRGRAGLVPRVS